MTVLKPLCGADDALERNLETFFQQDAPEFELVFGVEGDRDPAIPIVERLLARFPAVRARLVIHPGGRGLNPKVSNLLAMLESGAHDLVIISDSNIAVGPGYVSEMIAPLGEDGVGMVTSLVAGVGEETAGATLENLELNGHVAPCMAVTRWTGRTVVVGKSVAFRRSVLDPLGGLRSTAHLLAEDYVLGRMVHEAGLEVRLSRTPIRNVCAKTSVAGFFRRYLRWGLMRFRMQPLLHLAEPVLSPVAVAIACLALGAGAWVIGWSAALVTLRDAIGWIRMRGPQGLARALPLALLKELFLFAAWALSPSVRHVSWRGHGVRVSAGTRLYVHETPPPAIRQHEPV